MKPQNRFLKVRTFLQTRYNYLLAFLILIFIFYPFIYKFRFVTALITFFLFSFIAVSLFGSIKRKKFFLLSSILIITCVGEILIDLIKVLNDNLLIFTSISFVFCIYLILTIILHLNKIINYKTINSDAIKGGICVYILLAILWSCFYEILHKFQPSAFNIISTERLDYLYFSFITLMTVGYGDITPKSDFAKVLSTLEALTGQIYLATYIARLVGINIAVRLKAK